LSAGEYVSKMGWDISQEVTKGHTKKAKQGRFAPFDLLNEYLNTGALWAKLKYREYAQATFGLQYLSRFPKLLAMYDISNDLSDEDIASERLEITDYLGSLTFDQWKRILKHDLRGAILNMTEKHGFTYVFNFVESLPPDK